MKKYHLILLPALLACLLLCACGTQDQETGNPPEKTPGESKGTWTQVTDAEWTMEDYDATTNKDITQVPEDWTLPQDVEIDSFTRVEVCGDLILYGPTYETAMMEGFTVARYADGTLTPIYTFDEGMTDSWQSFFSPDGKHIAFPWKISDGKPGGWQIRVVDLEGDLEEDVALPQWENEISILFVKWYDDTNLQVTAWGIENGNISPEETAHWIYTFPTEPSE
ncbi:MAG: hypothetical protein MR419_10815 [Clostridiales bacterium]|nr:hypothetical protein [Clostridiales bacterium]MDY4171581.1 hypothetical protein [Evtepia sp.]